MRRRSFPPLVSSVFVLVVVIAVSLGFASTKAAVRDRDSGSRPLLGAASVLGGKTGSFNGVDSAATPGRALAPRVSALDKDTRSASKPKQKTVAPPVHSVDPPVVPPADPKDPPVDPPADPKDPPVDHPTDPKDPPVDPPADPEDPPAPPAAPGVVAGVTCISADMADVVTFDAPASGGSVTSFALLRASSAEGSFGQVATATAESRTFRYSVEETSTAVYAVVAIGPGGQGPRSVLVDNAVVSIATDVTSDGGILRSSNGEVMLALAPGTFTSPTMVTIDEVAGAPTGGILSLAGVYRIEPSGALQAPATLSVAYTLAVTHHQVSAALLKAASLMTYDEATGQWVSGASGIRAEAGYVTGTLNHFSEWFVGTIQPHGTSPESVDYCSGVCHDLATSVGSTLRYAARDSQVCYNCHGNPDLAGAPLGASGENVQSSFSGVSIVSKHPVATGGLYCTACHNPHADPAASPGLLRAYDAISGKAVTTGTAYCWTCHGTVSNRTINALVPGYFIRTGGNKKTAFNGAHNAVSSNTVRLDSAEELQQGLASSTQVQANGTVTVAQTPIELPKTATATADPAISGDYLNSPPRPGQAYDGSVATKVFWFAATMGANAGNGWIGSSSLTVDLQSMTRVSSFDVNFLQNTSTLPHIIEVQTSTDGVAWTSLVSQGVYGVGLPISGVVLEGSADCRYVRFVFRRDFTVYPTGLVAIAELTVHGMSSRGTFDFRPDIARKSTYTGGVVRWSASVPSPAVMAVTARASLNNGSTWTAWQPVTNGGSLTQIPTGSNLENALLEVRATLDVVGSASPVLDWIEVTTNRGAITGTTPTWVGDSPANQCQRCHVSHGSESPGLVAAGSTAACTNCHAAAYGSYSGQVSYAASVHAAVGCAQCHGAHGKLSGTSGVYAFLLSSTRREACLSCHTVVKAAFNAAQNADSQWAKHDVFSAEQVRTGSRIACRNCHSTHTSATGLVNPDSLGTSFVNLINDPTSIPTSEVVIYASKDTLLDSTTGQQAWNYGSSSQVTLTPSNRVLLYFDLSSIPAGVTIQNATLVLWGTNPNYTVYKGGYGVLPVTRDWLEGVGTGTANSAGVNGATWLESSFGTNWTTVGGDYGTASVSNSSGMSALNVTTLVQSLYAGVNRGIGVLPTAADNSLPFYMREAANQQNRPKLRIVYQTGPATRQIVDDITFCNKCHDGTMPLGLTGQSMTNIAGMYPYSSHGAAKGDGSESSAFNFYSADTGGGGLKAPYSYGMDALPCTTCHDPHGSRLPYHLKEVVNGRVMTPLFPTGWTYADVEQGKSLGYFCGACHIFPSNHSGYETAIGTACASGCHSHGN